MPVSLQILKRNTDEYELRILNYYTKYKQVNSLGNPDKTVYRSKFILESNL